MSKKSNIGKLEKVPLRDIWKNECSDFSTWLADNIDYLAEAIDMNLEVVETEKSPNESRFSIDILAENDNGDYVIIENQLEKTDHKHLGQIITYLSNLEGESKYAVWIAKSPRQEHVNAVNWLNEVSDKSIFLLKLEAYKIGDSKPAPFFSVICQPDEVVKQFGKDKKDLQERKRTRRARRDAADTLLVPARKDSFERVFLGENCWYAIRLRDSRIEQLKYIAVYQTAPISAVTHIAKIAQIVPHEDTGKYKVIFDGKAEQINKVPLGKDSRHSPQSPTYITKSSLKTANSVKELLADIQMEKKK